MSSLSGTSSTTNMGAVVSRSCRVADVSYRAFLASNDAPRIHWADPAGVEISGVGAAARISVSGEERFETVREWAETLFADRDYDVPRVARPRVLGGFAFLDSHEAGGEWPGFPAAEFVLPRIQLLSADDETWLTVTHTDGVSPTAVEEHLGEARACVEALPAMQPGGHKPGVTQTTPTPGEDAWREQVGSAVERIRAGKLQKVALATTLQADLADEVDGRNLLERLRQRYPECFRFLIEPTDAAAFVGATPERLATLQDSTVLTSSLAGSVGRGDTPAEDAELADRLREDKKLCHEQQLVTEDIAERLRSLGTITVGNREVLTLSNIQHLETPIEADVDPGTHVLDVVEALHPTPAVGGLPAKAALDTIRELEDFERGWYAAPVGWFDEHGEGTFGVGIRSAIVSDHEVTMFAGNGIVADSDPVEEYDEIQLKYRPVLDELE